MKVGLPALRAADPGGAVLAGGIPPPRALILHEGAAHGGPAFGRPPQPMFLLVPWAAPGRRRRVHGESK